jgi:small-conductance mechanosensitive channel
MLKRHILSNISTLKEITNSFSQTFKFKLFDIGQTSISLSSVLIFLLVFTSLVVISKFVTRLIANRFMAKLTSDSATIFTFRRISFYLMVIISAIFSLQFIGVGLGGLGVIIGLLSVGIGFGLQNITSNFISGIIMLFERPIKIGDRVTVGDTVGDVISINMRSTTIRTLHNVSIIVPNSEFVSSKVINWSHDDPRIRLDINVGVSYNSDLDRVIQALKEVAVENRDVLREPKPDVLHLGFGDSAWNMQLRVWIGNPHGQFKIRSDLNCAIVRKFREHGVEIPYPQRDLHVNPPQSRLDDPTNEAPASDKTTSGKVENLIGS